MLNPHIHLGLLRGKDFLHSGPGHPFDRGSPSGARWGRIISYKHPQWCMPLRYVWEGRRWRLELVVSMLCSFRKLRLQVKVAVWAMKRTPDSICIRARLILKELELDLWVKVVPKWMTYILVQASWQMSNHNNDKLFSLMHLPLGPTCRMFHEVVDESYHSWC